MEFFALYLRRRLPLAAMLALFAAVFAAVFLLCRIPLRAIVYPLILCFALGLPFLIFDIITEKRKYSRLIWLSKLRGELMTDFPAPSSPAEKGCREVIDALLAELKQLDGETSSKYRDTVEYYTLWVHQIKTPIASMRLTLQNEDTPVSRRLESDLGRIEQYAEMALAYLRLDSPSSDYVFRECSLDGIIRRSVKRFAAEFIDRRLTLEYRGIDKTVVTDEKWLQFALEQIISNALKYTREGGITVTVSDPCTVVISDTGIGIVPEDLPRIFEKGYTGVNGRRDKRASGIGLYLCRRILKNLGAEISVSSVPDSGTEVKIYLEQYDLKTE